MTSRASRVRYVGTVESITGSEALVVQPGDMALVIRGVPRWVVMKCPCACGDTLRVNLDPRAGPAWRLWIDARGATLYPSVWRDTGCEAHFIVFDDRIWLANAHWHEWDVSELSSEAVLALLGAQPRHLLEIADDLGVTGWEVLPALRQLVREARARETPARSGKYVRVDER